MEISLSEAKRLISQWSKGTLPTVALSIKYHFERHGKEVSAENVWHYLRKAEAFGRNLRGARTSILRNDFTCYMKNGYYMIKNEAGKIISFGLER
jgi:filamentous hemagglutinin